jgi:hypothetical protein
MLYFRVFTIAVVYGGMSLASASSLNLFSGLTTQGPINSPDILSFTDDYGTGTVTARGFTTNGGTQTNLYYKTAGGDETGLGMFNDPAGDHEISGTAFVQLDFTALLAQYLPANPFKLVSAAISLGSVQGGEGYTIYGSNSSGTEGAVLGSGGSDGTVTLTLAQLKTSPFISIAASSGNVLIDAASVTTTQVATPEPATSALMGGWLLGALFLVRRRRQPAKV